MTPAEPQIILTGVRGKLSCAHGPVNADLFGGEVHGHSYEVWAWFDNPDGLADARVFQAALDQLLALWDHKMLPPELATGEALARAIGLLAKVREVEVRRPLEGLAARWIDRSLGYPQPTPQKDQQSGLRRAVDTLLIAGCDDSAGQAGEPPEPPTGVQPSMPAYPVRLPPRTA